LDEPIRESGPHLAGLLETATQGEGPLYRCLSDALKRAIDRGEIPLGTVLPPERTLARSLSVSRATVVAAYDRLKTEGWLQSRQGSGTWVRRPERDGRHGEIDAVSTGRLFLSDDGQDQRSGPGEPALPDEQMVDLTVAALSGSPIVNQTLASLTTEDVARLTEHHGYVPHGLRRLREVIAERLAPELPTPLDHIVITTGAHQAISLVARQALNAGDTVLVESPTFPGALDIFRRFAARMVPLPVDADGARTDVLPDLIARTQPTLIYLSPHFHNPTGAVLPTERRREIARIAEETGIVVVEDLAQADVALEDMALPPPIASFAPQAPIHTLGSTAKLFWAGLRIGWLRSPEDWSARMLATKTVADLGSPLVSQMLAVRLYERIEEVQQERREQLVPQRDLVCRLLAERLPDWQYRCPAGGLSLWITIPQGNADEFAEVATRHGVAIVPGPSLSVDDGNRRSLRLVFTRPPHVLEEGVRRLAIAWANYAPTTNRSTARLLV
jgi:DNA-binding transcriptional MocR family regulator